MDNNHNFNQPAQPNDVGMTMPVQDFGATMPAYPQQPYNQPQAGMTQPVYPGQPYNQPQAGMTQPVYPGQPYYQPQAGMTQPVYPGQPYPQQSGFNTGYAQQPYTQQSGFITGYAQQPYAQPKQKKPLSKKTKIAIISTIAVVLLAVALVLIIRPKTGAKTKEKAAIEFLKAWSGRDAKKMIKYSLPKKIQKDAEKYVKSENYGYYYTRATSLLDAYNKAYLSWGDTQVKVRNFKVDTLETYSPSEIKEFEEELREECNVNIDISALVRVKIYYDYMESGDDSWYNEYEKFYVYKYKNRWYVFPSYILDT